MLCGTIAKVIVIAFSGSDNSRERNRRKRLAQRLPPKRALHNKKVFITIKFRS